MVKSASPFALFDELIDKGAQLLQPPAWAVHEIQQRTVLFLNHVLQQENEARTRLARQCGRVVEVRWRTIRLRLAATRAGLLELAPGGAEPDLSLTIAQASPLDIAQAALRGDKPAVQIVGDVQLAAEVNWLVDHVRWDVEEDLARLVGDVPAHAIGSAARRLVAALRQFIGKAAGAVGRT